MWYAMNDRRQVIGVRLIGPSESEADAVSDLSELTYGSVVCQPLLTLHRHGASSKAVAALLLGLARGRTAHERAESPA